MTWAKPRDVKGQDRQLRDLQRQVRRWCDVERAMNRAPDLRAKRRAELLAAGFRCLWQRVVARRNFTPSHAKAAACALMFAGPVALGGVALPSTGAFAQEKIAVATRALGTDAATDQARLAELGISMTAIEQCEDAELLWRAVRELVLPQRVSEPIQQRILRRVWVLDPDIAKGSLLESETQ
ncbi:MAG TPA: hypothetical protein VIF14_17010 [Alphaproteobacteria bacterium]